MPKTSSTMGGPIEGRSASVPDVPALPVNYLELTDEQLAVRLTELRAARANTSAAAEKRAAKKKDAGVVTELE